MRLQRKQAVLCMAAGMLAAACLTGCGGEWEKGAAGSSERENAVSGSAVSGAAVSGAAVLEQEEQSGEEKYVRCNDDNIYYLSQTAEDSVVVDEGIVERDRTDGTEQYYPMPRGEYLVDILWADNSWVYYVDTIEFEDKLDSTWQFWRIPVEKKEGRYRINPEKKELVLEEEKAILELKASEEYLFCNGRWIVYTLLDGSLRQYDIQKKKYVEQDRKVDIWDRNARGVYMSNVNEENEYWLDGESGSLVPFKLPGEYYRTPFLCEEGIVSVYSGSQAGDLLSAVLWHYPDAEHPAGWEEVLCREDEVAELLKNEGCLEGLRKDKLSCETVNVFTREDTFYWQLLLQSRENKVTTRRVVVLSCKLGGGEIQVERELSRILENPAENQKVFLKIWGGPTPASKALFLSRGVCIDMTEQYAFFYFGEKGDIEVLACYEFHTGKWRKLKKTDTERYLLVRNHNASLDYLFTKWIDYVPSNGDAGYE